MFYSEGFWLSVHSRRSGTGVNRCVPVDPDTSKNPIRPCVQVGDPPTLSITKGKVGKMGNKTDGKDDYV